MSYGPIKINVNNMKEIREILLKEGFRDSIFQIWKEGQIFGLIKKLNNDLEMHVRGFEDFTLDSEIELSREYLEHPYECKPFYGPLIKILKYYGMPFKILYPLPKDPYVIMVPVHKTSWKPLVIIGGLSVLFLIALKLREEQNY